MNASSPGEERGDDGRDSVVAAETAVESLPEATSQWLAERRIRRELLEAVPDAVLLIGFDGYEEGRILDANTLAATSHGYEREDLIGRSIGLLDSREDAIRVGERIAALRQRGNLCFQVTHRRRDGSVFPVEVHARVANISGRKCIVSFNRDITERNRVAAQLRATEVQLTLAAQASRVGFWNWELGSGRITYNPKWQETVGFGDGPAGETFDAWANRVHPDDLPLALAAIRRHLDGNSPDYSTEYRLRFADDQYRWILARGEMVTADGGRMTGLVGCHIDITAQKLAERERTEVSERMSRMQRLEAMGTLAGGIAHDFNNILAIISGNVELALLDQPPPETRSALDEIAQAGQRARALVRQVLAFSRNEAPQLATVELRPLLEEAVRLLRGTIPRSIDLVLDAPTTELAARADSDQLVQVIINLGTNAWHAIGEGPGTITIRAAAADEHEIELVVADDGRGISEQTRERVFEPFFTTKPKGQGSGLGLSVVHGIIESHEGHIEVESNEGQGTTFRIGLPRATLEPAPVIADTTVRATPHVLLVDDEPSLLDTLRRGLERRDFTVTAHTSPIAALTALEDGLTCDLLVTDHDMPEISGVELAGAVRRSRPELPILLCSGFLPGTAIDDPTKVGVDRTLAKPVLPSELGNAILAMLST
ncbi:MAG: PAS domain S-box protein [bacterium]|nr:PAS domain S-box protein [bacterium]